MRKYMILVIILFVNIFSAYATVHIIRVSDFQFSPKRVNAVVGDTIKWIWKTGFHTTTSTKVPHNAAAWDAPMNTDNKRFLYTVTKAGTYKYQCNIHPSVMMGTITVTTSLTAGLNNFEVNSNENSEAVINWQTGSDNNIAYYSIQRSADGENFKEINRVNPPENSAAAKSYQYIDDKTGINNQYVYYMVEMVDKTGNSQFSDIKMFIQKVKTAPLVTSISPNPINNSGHLMFQFNADKEGSMLVELFNESGKFIKQTEMSAVAGLNNGHFYLGTLPPGTYYIVCTLDLKKEKHLVIVK